MRISTEKVNIEAAGDLTLQSGASLDARDGTAGFYPPQIATASLPAAAGVKGMLVYDTTANKLKVSNGSAWETITSS
ncbi:MAG: hypothetical protein GX557_03765 [Chloroflexi bacterium]|nr:hypothetical protein [Chloroflexota bacterium]